MPGSLRPRLRPRGAAAPKGGLSGLVGDAESVSATGSPGEDRGRLDGDLGGLRSLGKGHCRGDGLRATSGHPMPAAQASATCRGRMQRTSSMVCGCCWREWPERTTSSESTPSIWALVYLTTPSSPVRPRSPQIPAGASAPQLLLGLQPRLQAILSHPKAENGTADAFLRGTPFSMLLHAGNHGVAIRQTMAEGHRGISRTRLGPKGEGTPRSLERANLPLASFHVRRPL